MPPNARVCAKKKKKKKERRKKEITPTRLARCRRSRGRLSRTALAKLQRGGALRRGDCRSWPSFFLVWSETCAPLPFPHPNLSLYYYRLARGAQRGARWAARYHSKPCVCCLERCVLLGFFFLTGLSSCVIARPGDVVTGSIGRVAGWRRGPRVFQRVSKWRLDSDTKQRLYEFRVKGTVHPEFKCHMQWPIGGPVERLVVVSSSQNILAA